MASAEPVNRYLQRLLGGAALAREYSEADLSPMFSSNGTSNPGTTEYAALADGKFANWRLRIEGQVARPVQFSLPDLRAFPARTQITRHDCVEGWSCIASGREYLFGHFCTTSARYHRHVTSCSTAPTASSRIHPITKALISSTHSTLRRYLPMK
jgi:hypothetical protein